MNIDITYGTESKALEFPESKLGTYISGPRCDLQCLEMDIDKALETTLASPVGTKTLRELAPGKKVGVIIPDEFRAGPHRAILKAIAKQLEGVDYRSVTVLVSTGSHSPVYFTKNIKNWFQEIMGHLPNVSLHANDIENDEYVDLGTTERGTPVKVNKFLMETDLRIYCHEAKFHYMNGFSIIDKLLLPGMCAMETIELNHKISLDSDRCCAGRSPYVEDSKRQDNPMALDIMEARRTADKSALMNGSLKQEPEADVDVLGLDMVTTGDEILWVGAGEVETVNREMVKMVDQWAKFEVKKTKYVVISPGGPPSSTTVYSLQNCFDMALKGAIKEGGEALLIAPCEGKPDMPEDVRGLSPSIAQKGLFYDTLVKLKDRPYPEARKYIEDNFRLGFWKTNRILDLINVKNIKLYLYSTLPPEKLAPSGIIPVEDPQAWIDERVQRGDGDFNVIDGGNRLFILGGE